MSQKTITVRVIEKNKVIQVTERAWRTMSQVPKLYERFENARPLTEVQDEMRRIAQQATLADAQTTEVNSETPSKNKR